MDAAQREKSMLQSKTLELERMHLHMKEALGAEIDYLRKLNIHFVNQQVKCECSVLVGGWVGGWCVCVQTFFPQFLNELYASEGWTIIAVS